MKRSILLLNLLLFTILAVGSYELRRRWLEGQSREARLLAVQPSSTPLPAQTNAAAAPQAQKLQAVQYFEVAERFLFSRDRNPNVVIERKPEPPPKVMPNFPAVFGVMDIGMGPTVFMSVDRGSQQGYKLGDKIGEFTLLAANQKEITFEWEGKPVTKSLDDLRAKPQENASQQGPVERMSSNVNNAPPPMPIQRPPENVRPAPGADIGGGRRGCLPGDSSPAGTTADGYKKVSTNYAFGPICYWESTR
jgi:hypothetical protein